jgi:LysM repeat protein
MFDKIYFVSCLRTIVYINQRCINKFFILLGMKKILLSGLPLGSILLALLIIVELFIFGSRERHVTGVNDYIKPPEIPEKFDYCGEPVPLQDEEVRERFDRELLGNAFWQSNVLLHMKKMIRYFPTIEMYLKKYNLPTDLKFIAVAESGLSTVVSPVGASGYWQFMPETGKMYGLEINDEIDERYDINKSTDAACRYLKDMQEIFQSWTLATAAYNCGVGGIKQNISYQKVKNYYDLYLNQETSRYIFRIMALKEILTHPDKYKYLPIGAAGYKPYNTVEVAVSGDVANWADWAINHGINYKTLKTLNPWLRKHKLTNKTHKTYMVEIPADKSQYKPDPALAQALDAEEQDTNSSLHKLEDAEATTNIYTVKKGETLTSVAAKLKVTEQELKHWNNLKTNVVKAGQKLKYQLINDSKE